MARRLAQRAADGARAFRRPVPAVRAPDAGGGGPQRRDLRLREGRLQDRRRGGLRRRLEARLLRLGIQEEEAQPRPGDGPARALRRRAGEPAAAGRLRQSTASASAPRGRTSSRARSRSRSRISANRRTWRGCMPSSTIPTRSSPSATRERVTREAADKFSALALRFQGRAEPEPVAHFVNQLVFCFFASSVKLLPEGMFQALIARAQKRPKRAKGNLDEMFAQMRTGGEFALQDIAHFNGGLFDGQPALEIDQGDADLLIAGGEARLGRDRPHHLRHAVRALPRTPAMRAQIGAHYTDPAKIMMIVEPVVLRPLRAEWETARAGNRRDHGEGRRQGRYVRRRAAAACCSPRRAQEAEATQLAFLERGGGGLRAVLDPRPRLRASGNFLYLRAPGGEGPRMARPSRRARASASSRARPRSAPKSCAASRSTRSPPSSPAPPRGSATYQWRIRIAIYTRPRPDTCASSTRLSCANALITRPRTGAWWRPAGGGGVQSWGTRRLWAARRLIADSARRRRRTIREVYSHRISRSRISSAGGSTKARKADEDGSEARGGLVATLSIAERNGDYRGHIPEAPQPHFSKLGRTAFGSSDGAPGVCRSCAFCASRKTGRCSTGEASRQPIPT